MTQNIFPLSSAGTAEYTNCIFANDCFRYDSKQPDNEAQVMLELWELWNTLLLPSLPGPQSDKIKWDYFQVGNHEGTTVWMHNLNSNETLQEKAR